MVYDPRRERNDWRTFLLPEEEDIQRALKDYTADPDKAHPDDFVPTKVLHDTYCRYARQMAGDPDTPPPLNISSFGAALMVVFPDLDNRDPETGHNDSKVRRTYHGKPMWGYRGIVGPESVRTRDYVGRPSKDPRDDND